MTCEVCGREKYEVGTETDGVCLRDDSLREIWAGGCWRIGYEREKARVEKAEKNWREAEQHNNDLLKRNTAEGERADAAEAEASRAWRSNNVNVEALAAARRALLEISAGNLDNEPPDAFQERACDVARAALAAPAAGEEG